LYSRKCAYSRGAIFAGEDYEFAVAIRGKRGLSMLFLDPSLTVRFPYIYCLICFWGSLGKTHPKMISMGEEDQWCNHVRRNKSFNQHVVVSMVGKT